MEDEKSSKCDWLANIGNCKYLFKKENESENYNLIWFTYLALNLTEISQYKIIDILLNKYYS